jgi:hypothetical protein
MLADKVHSFTAELLRATRTIEEWNYELVLCPLRGARMPGIQARTMSNNPQGFRAFDGTEMSQGNNDERILNELRSILLSANRRTGARKIGVFDTAKGGHSCATLARLLRKLADEVGGRQWEINFHLIHPIRHIPSKAYEAAKYNSTEAKIDFTVQLYSVQDLLIEDEPSLLGYDKVEVGNYVMAKRFQENGEILYCEGDKVTRYKGLLDETMLGIIAKAITEELQTHPDAT